MLVIVGVYISIRLNFWFGVRFKVGINVWEYIGLLFFC